MKSKTMATKNVWDRVLAPSEKIQFEFSLGNRYIALARNSWIVLGIPFLFLYGLGIIFIIVGFLWGWYLRRAHHFAFTDKRILILKGWLSTHLTSVDYNKITDVRVLESLFERFFFKTGRLIINTAGTDVPEIQLTNIGSPYEVKKKLDTIREKVKL